jgi:hypothetical protein
VTPHGSIRLTVRVEDDFGVADVTLRAEPLGGEVIAVSLTDHMTTSRDEVGFEGEATYVWEVGTMGLSPGDVVRYEVTAVDNCVADEVTGQLGRSPAQTLKVISESEFDLRAREDLAQYEDRLRRAAVEQADIRDATGTHVHADDTPAAVLTDLERGSVATLVSRQARLGRQLREIATRLEELSARMTRGNNSGDRDAGDGFARRVEQAAMEVRQIAGGPMAAAGRALGQARDLGDARSQQDGIAEAMRSQEAAADRLHALLGMLAQWGSFRGLTSRTRDLLDRQDRLRDRTAQLGGSMLGKSVEALTREEASSLRRVERQQQRLADDVQQLMTNMARLRKTTGERHPVAAEAIDKALRAARAHGLEKRIRSAAEAIGENRTAAAGIDQRAVAEGLKKMIRALRERERRELAELRKRLERAEDLVAELIQRQESLKLATNEAGMIEAEAQEYQELAREQRGLGRDSEFAADEMAALGGRSGRGLVATRLVRRAVAPMEQAAAHLDEMKADDAGIAQDDALGLLEQALSDLEQLARQSAEESLRRSLAQIHEDLEQMHSAQTEINKGISKLQVAISERGRVGRSEARDASRLAREQSEVRDMVTMILPDLRAVPVYEWAMQRIAQWMDEGRDRLDARAVDEELVATTGRIARELEKLLAAIVETRAMPSSAEFVEAERAGGGGEGGRTGVVKPVPTVAELLVLKAMQIDINARTEELDLPADSPDVTEEHLRRLTVVGEDQAEVRRLAELVTARVRGH